MLNIDFKDLEDVEYSVRQKSKFLDDYDVINISLAKKNSKTQYDFQVNEIKQLSAVLPETNKLIVEGNIEELTNEKREELKSNIRAQLIKELTQNTGNLIKDAEKQISLGNYIGAAKFLEIYWEQFMDDLNRKFGYFEKLSFFDLINSLHLSEQKRSLLHKARMARNQIAHLQDAHEGAIKERVNNCLYAFENLKMVKL